MGRIQQTSWVAGFLAAANLLTATPAWADAYDDAFAAAEALDRAGRPAEAASALSRALPLYPQDFALPREIAWRHFQSGRYDLAERYYRVALALSPSAPEAQLGLAASLERQGRCEEALPVYQGLSADFPAAESGVRRCTPPPSWKVATGVSLTGMTFPSHTYKSLAGMVALGLAFEHRSGFSLGGTYRYGRFSPADGAGIDAWDQHEAYASLGFQRPFWGLAAQYGFVHDGSGALGASHHVGLTGRLSPFGDLEVRASASFYDDMSVYRVEPSWRIPIAFGLSIRPAVAIQSADGEAKVSGSGTLSLDRSRFGLFVGGKYGDEVRPAYLSLPVVYNILDTVKWGVWGGGSVNVTKGVRIHASYAMDRLEQPDGAQISAHALTLGVNVTF
jgi:hypothetical protein